VRNLETHSLTQRSPPALMRMSLVGAHEMLGSEVVDSEGKRVGELIDMMLDLRAARVAYGVVALDHAPDWSEKLVAVPWNVMHVDLAGDLRINARKDWIERAPSMQPELMPTLLDHEWAVFIHSYFGAKPYWERNAQHA
jgi:sporulation protein YlmC with PRC-barrel domain